MTPYDVILGTLYLSQTGLGVLGNSILLSFLIFSGHKLKPKDQIISHLTLANSIFLLSRGIPLTISVFGVKDFLDDTSCKFDFYVIRFSRGFSLSSTCLLGCFQAIVISPINTSWIGVRARAPNIVTSSCLFCWLFNLLIEVATIIAIAGPQSHNTNFTAITDLIICSWKAPTNNFVLLTTFRDLFSVGLMVCTSVYKVVLLRKHHQQVYHLYKNSLCPKTSPEMRVTGTILLLVSTFVTFYLANGIFAIYQSYFLPSSLWLVNVSGFLVQCFPTISPFLLISRDRRMARTCCSPRGRHKPCSPASCGGVRSPSSGSNLKKHPPR